MAFTQEQKIEMDRMHADRKAEHDLAKLEKHEAKKLRAKVNIIGVSDTVNFAPENDYTAQEMAYIEAAKPRSKWMTAIPEILDRAVILEGEGLSPTAVAEILKG